MILILDNYDSFVDNLARYTRELGFDCELVRNDAIDVDQIRQKNPSHIIISPGPCRPAQAGVAIELIQRLGDKIPILGICLGHQAIGEAFGGQVVRAIQPMHGRASMIRHQGCDLLAGLENPLRVARYHSLVVERESLPSCLEVCALSDEGEIMALQHQQWPVYGLQFHPESILTDSGHQMIKRFLTKDPTEWRRQIASEKQAH
jgi:para-aminobenzoate synthetase component II